MKVILGLKDIASQLQDFRVGFEALGHEVTTVANRRIGSINSYEMDHFLNDSEPLLKYCPSHKLRKRLRRYTPSYVKTWLREAVKHTDLFLFVGETFFYDQEDLNLIKAAGCKIVVVFVGTEIFWQPAADQEFDKFGLERIRYPEKFRKNFSKARHLNTVLRYLRKAEKYADLIVTEAGYSQLALRPYHRYRQMLPIKGIDYNPQQRQTKPIVVFAPTNDAYKGSQFVLEAMDELKREGVNFEADIFRGLPNKAALKRYANGDILVGELFYPGGGKQQREALAAGMAVLTNCDPRYPSYAGEAAPFVHVDKGSIKRVLKEIIEDYQYREDLSVRGREYAERNLDPTVMVGSILDAIESSSTEIEPTFFREEFVPSKKMVEVFNKWNDYVKDCHWYRDAVKNQTRSGLRF